MTTNPIPSTDLSAKEVIAKAIEIFQSGNSTAFELSEQILKASTLSAGSLTPDIDRRRRSGYPEVVYAEGKESWDNPYSFISETLAAYAWEEGYKRGTK